MENRGSDVTQIDYVGSDVERGSEECRRNEGDVLIQNMETIVLLVGQNIEKNKTDARTEEEQVEYGRGQRHRQPPAKFKDYVMHTARCIKYPFALIVPPSKTSCSPYPMANFVTCNNFFL